MLHTNLNVNEAGHLTFAGADTVSLCEKYGTPLMLLDEGRVRENLRTYLRAMKEAFGEGSFPCYASKALSFTGIYRIIAEEGAGIDLVSPGELFTAARAGFPLARAFFHGNNKTDEDIRYAHEAGVGYFVVDNREELMQIEEVCAARGSRQKILLRLTPGIDPHTHAKISTGQVDSKFGTAIETGQAMEMVAAALACPHIHLAGYHCHVGSQCFDSRPFIDAADIMLGFIADVRARFGITAEILNLGGGYGVRYIEAHPHIDIAENIALVATRVDERCTALDLPRPHILLEPGRSIVADAGLTLYTCGSVKTITGYKSYVSIDGGMADNPRYALYQSDYTVVNASRADAPADFVATVAGRCCESGDLIQEDVAIARPTRGDRIAVLVTGAYNYAMASNYNRLPRPPIVLLRDGADSLAVRRESYEDLVRNDI